jgi:hypothetical protein
MKAKPEKSNLIGEELPISMGPVSCSAVALKNLRLAVMKMYLDKQLSVFVFKETVSRDGFGF